MKKHPDDVLTEAESIGSATARFASWKADNKYRLDALILTYPDDDAMRLLEALREQFWSEVLK